VPGPSTSWRARCRLEISEAALLLLLFAELGSLFDPLVLELLLLRVLLGGVVGVLPRRLLSHCDEDITLVGPDFVESMSSR
jgi:hypothetical protein